jgi:hypothetical protein
MNNFLASGGDGFSVFNEGTDQVGELSDLARPAGPGHANIG